MLDDSSDGCCFVPSHRGANYGEMSSEMTVLPVFGFLLLGLLVGRASRIGMFCPFYSGEKSKGRRKLFVQPSPHYGISTTERPPHEDISVGKVRHDAERLSAPRRGRRRRDLGQELTCSRAACLRLETKASKWALLEAISRASSIYILAHAGEPLSPMPPASG